MNNLILQKNIPKPYAFIKYSWIAISWIRIERFLWIHYLWFIYFFEVKFSSSNKTIVNAIILFHKIAFSIKFILIIFDLFLLILYVIGDQLQYYMRKLISNWIRLSYTLRKYMKLAFNYLYFYLFCIMMTKIQIKTLIVRKW